MMMRILRIMMRILRMMMRILRMMMRESMDIKRCQGMMRRILRMMSVGSKIEVKDEISSANVFSTMKHHG